MQLLLAALVVYRLLYHVLYMDLSPFALGTFSDGRLYEAAAFDIARHPPLGTQVHYLQGLYAYFMALPLFVSVRIAFRLFLQLLVAWLALWLFYRTTSGVFGRMQGALSTIVLLAHPMLAFYENKFVSAELGIACNIVALSAFGWMVARPRTGRIVACGAAAGLTVLARPNMLLAVPFTALAVALVVGPARRTRVRALAGFAVGVVLALAPMAVRNGIVTGRPTVFPAHGGGTSFYIGNNPDATGVWNTVGGLITGQVSHERTELVEELGLEGVPTKKLPAAIGRALYGRAFAYMREQPVDYLGLQAKKVWLTFGNDELTQDYDRWGEREMVPLSSRGLAPFAVVLGLGALGGMLLWRNGRGEETRNVQLRPWLWVLLGQVVAVVVANVVFFTSAQHRLPLVVPLAFCSGPALVAIHGRLRGVPVPPWVGSPGKAAVIVASVLVLQSVWPRTRVREPSAIHYYNLAVVQDWIGEPRQALETLDRAVDRRPDHPVIRLHRAMLARRMRQYAKADHDLDHLQSLPHVPAWIAEEALRERWRVDIDRAAARAAGKVGPRR